MPNPFRDLRISVLWMMGAIACVAGDLSVADELRFEGLELKGSITDINGSRVTFDTGYGSLVVPFHKIEALSSDKPLHIIHGDVEGTTGRVLGVEGPDLLVGESFETAKRIPIVTVHDSDTLEELESLGERLRNRYRYWKASVQAGLSYTDQTNDEVDINFGIEIRRIKDPTRLVGRLRYIFGSDRPKGRGRTTSDNELRAFLKGEYNVSENGFLFTNHDFENDEIDRISIRWVGSIGPGYKLINTENYRFQFEAGPGYYYQRNFGGDEDDYATVTFAVDAEMKLWLGTTLEGRTTYAPAFDDWVDNYVILSELFYRVPVRRHLSLHITLNNTYDNTPADDVQKNETKLLMAIAFNF